MVGREREMAQVSHLLAEADAGRGGMMIISGGGGVGKSRLLREACAEADRRGMRHLTGRTSPVERGIPYAPFADGFIPLFNQLNPEELATLTRGSEAELRYFFSPMGSASLPDPGQDHAELKARLLWSFSHFLSRLSARRPLLVVLDDLQWADTSSIELLHFIARRITGDRIALIAAYNDELIGGHPEVTAVEESLISIGAARRCELRPHSLADITALVCQTFDVPESATREFVAMVFGWTRGNPFFVDEVLKTLVDKGRLRRVDGRWTGWDLMEIDLPSSVRDSVRGRFRSLPERVRTFADILAVVGTSIAYEALLPLSGTDELSLLSGLEELRKARLIEERLEGGVIVYDFVHPMVREALYSEMGLARARRLHGQVAEALEAFRGTEALQYADELAYHYVRAGDRMLASKAVKYLSVAGKKALQKQANREAADYLGAALERVSDDTHSSILEGLIEDLARARQRLGDLVEAGQLWQRRLEIARASGDRAVCARVHRSLGYIEYWQSRYPEAMEHFQSGLDASVAEDDEAQSLLLHLARAECLMEMGRAHDAQGETEVALRIGERLGRRDLLARVHLRLLLLHLWTGPVERARFHRDCALQLAASREDPALRCGILWGAGLLEVGTGDLRASGVYIAEGMRLAEETRSPLHWLRMVELQVELNTISGDWPGALELAQKAVDTARALNQRSSLARLLVWMGLVHFGRGDLARGNAMVCEAWELSGAGREEPVTDVHAAVTAYAGRIGEHLHAGEYTTAIAVGEKALSTVDRSGYLVWAIHCIMPLLTEAYLMNGDLEGAARIGARLRQDSERLGHTLGIAWADACDALLVWLRGDTASGIRDLTAAAERLEAIPAVFDAARLRRHLAARLRDLGDREAALRELRLIHEIFLRLGAVPELAKTREQIRELGVRPPLRDAARGGGLSCRELEIARMAGRGLSNKA
ncbi:MAG: AAA family ATPase, partial [Gemmatimonadota bacterium]|nr:AAA family ATPase [Gemmatimonadota bacterium]